MITPLIQATIVAGFTSLLSPFLFRPLLVRLGVVDNPTERSSHKRPTIRGGGLAPILGMITGSLWLLNDPSGTNIQLLFLLLSTALLAGLVGLVEDVKGLKASHRAALQFLLGGLLTLLLCQMTHKSWLWIPLAALFFASNVNFANFMDGINGISALQGLVAGFAYAVLGMISSQSWLIASGLLTATVFVVFLPWNLIPPRMFLGDSGSYLLGAITAAMALAAIFTGLNPIAALSPLTIYWADTVTTIFRRLKRGESLSEAHRTHTYQRLTDTGFGHPLTSLIVAVCTLLTSGFGLLIATQRIHFIVGLILICVVCVGYLFFPRFRGSLIPEPVSDVQFQGSIAQLGIRTKDSWKPVNWVVVGSTGFVGSATVDYLESTGRVVTPIQAPRLKLNPRTSDGFEVAKLARSFSGIDALSDALSGADVVINAAGMAKPGAQASDELYGANALLPAVIALAANKVNVGRFIHLSSAAVQGDRKILDGSVEVDPFSPYSRSKALGESALLSLMSEGLPETDVVIVRATSVQGNGRSTTESLRKVARSPLASVAAPGDYPTVVSSITGLTIFLERVGLYSQAMTPILVQPWEGLNVRKVLEVAGGKKPLVLPRSLCLLAISVGAFFGHFSPKIAGTVRRVQLMWFGQEQEKDAIQSSLMAHSDIIDAILMGTPVND